jgi:hypothetical protein
MSEGQKYRQFGGKRMREKVRVTQRARPKECSDLMLENLGVLSCLSITLRRMVSTSSLTSGSSIREKDSSGSRNELGSAVSMLVVWNPVVTWGEGGESVEEERF